MKWSARFRNPPYQPISCVTIRTSATSPAFVVPRASSVHLRFGTISIRDLVRKAWSVSEKWVNELIWREFYQMILWHFRMSRSVHSKRSMTCSNGRTTRNCSGPGEGRTGLSIVDAGMRELNATGFMQQPGAHDHGEFPDEVPANRLAMGLTSLPNSSTSGGQQQRRLAVERRHRCRCRALLLHLQHGRTDPGSIPTFPTSAAGSPSSRADLSASHSRLQNGAAAMPGVL